MRRQFYVSRWMRPTMRKWGQAKLARRDRSPATYSARSSQREFALLSSAGRSGETFLILRRPRQPCELQPFSRSETATHLRQSFPNATEPDIDEFHRLSSRNPRVQATALSRPDTLPEVLRTLGPDPTSVEDTISQLLSRAVAELRDRAGPTEQTNIDLICAGLAALRPLIPIPVLAAISKVDEAAVRSFAVDLGRPLIVLDDTVQFFDEPAETWFREQFRPRASQLADFIERLRPLASTTAYVASALPS